VANKIEVGKTYTGDELQQLCGAGDDSRYYAVVGTKCSAIVLDAGNDNYKVMAISDYKEE
jgi:hypothetical protein